MGLLTRFVDWCMCTKEIDRALDTMQLLVNTTQRYVAHYGKNVRAWDDKVQIRYVQEIQNCKIR